MYIRDNIYIYAIMPNFSEILEYINYIHEQMMWWIWGNT